MLAELYRRRWDVEKVFDELKNKPGEKKASATSSEAKQTQAHLLTITHNLLLLYEQVLAVRHAVQNQAEDQRRRERKMTATNRQKKGPATFRTGGAGLERHPAQLEIHPLVARSAPLPTRGNHRRAPPQAVPCHLMTYQNEHRFSLRRLPRCFEKSSFVDANKAAVRAMDQSGRDRDFKPDGEKSAGPAPARPNRGRRRWLVREPLERCIMSRRRQKWR